MTGARGGLAQSVQARLVSHANRTGVDPNGTLTRYTLERFLYRLSLSPHRDRFVLKGALLMLAWLGDTLRPTRDPQEEPAQGAGSVGGRHRGA